jgi:hypothetical protein
VSSRLHIKDDCSHIINAVWPQGSNEPKDATGNSKEDSSEKTPNFGRSIYGF